MANEQGSATPEEQRDRQGRQADERGGIDSEKVLPIPGAPDGAWVAGANGMNVGTTGSMAGTGEGGPVWPPIGVTQGGAGVGETSAGGDTTPTGASIERGEIPGTGGSFEPEAGADEQDEQKRGPYSPPGATGRTPMPIEGSAEV